jgi:hypothetical protein
VPQLLVTAHLPSSQILSTLIMEEISSSETSVLIWVPQQYIPEDGILHSHRGENLKSYIILRVSVVHIGNAKRQTHTLPSTGLSH